MFYNINVYCIIFTQFTQLCEVVTIQSTNNVYASQTVMLNVRNITTTWFKQHWFYTGESIKSNIG